MTERHKNRINKLKALLELAKEKNTDGRLTEICTHIHDIIQDELSDDSNPGGPPPPPPGIQPNETI